MAHYVFQRDNGYGDYDYIHDFDTMEITDYKEEAAQVEDRFLSYIDMPYMNQLGFFAVGISRLALRIAYGPLLYRPLIMGYRPIAMPRPPRAHVPRPPRPRGRRPASPAPRPRAPRGGGIIGGILQEIGRAVADDIRPAPRRSRRPSAAPAPRGGRPAGVRPAGGVPGVSRPGGGRPGSGRPGGGKPGGGRGPGR